MVDCRYDPRAVAGQIVLSPNRSWTWRANLWFVATLMVISLLIATAFTLQGFWLILPFTALEMGVLTGCLYYCVRRTHTIEVLRLTRDSLVFERGINRPSARLEFERFFSRFLFVPARHPWQRNRVELKCRDEVLEIGRFLSDRDREDLVRSLRRLIHELDGAAPRYGT